MCVRIKCSLHSWTFVTMTQCLQRDRGRMSIHLWWDYISKKIQHKMSSIWHNWAVEMSLATLNRTDFPHLSTLTKHILHLVKMKKLSSKHLKILLKELSFATVSWQMFPPLFVTVPLGFLRRYWSQQFRSLKKHSLQKSSAVPNL